MAAGTRGLLATLALVALLAVACAEDVSPSVNGTSVANTTETLTTVNATETYTSDNSSQVHDEDELQKRIKHCSIFCKEYNKKCDDKGYCVELTLEELLKKCNETCKEHGKKCDSKGMCVLDPTVCTTNCTKDGKICHYGVCVDKCFNKCTHKQTCCDGDCCNNYTHECKYNPLKHKNECVPKHHPCDDCHTHKETCCGDSCCNKYTHECKYNHLKHKKECVKKYHPCDDCNPHKETCCGDTCCNKYTHECKYNPWKHQKVCVAKVFRPPVYNVKCGKQWCTKDKCCGSTCCSSWEECKLKHIKVKVCWYTWRSKRYSKWRPGCKEVCKYETKISAQCVKKAWYVTKHH